MWPYRRTLIQNDSFAHPSELMNMHDLYVEDFILDESNFPEFWKAKKILS